MTIGALAAEAGVTTGTVRYYERIGLLPKPARTPASYRLYPPELAHRLVVIRNAQQFGFSVRDITAFLRVRESGGRPCESVREAAQRMVTAVDAQIAELTTRRQQMVETLRQWDQKLARMVPGERARLLETLGLHASAGAPSGRRAPRRAPAGTTRRRPR
jgi:DNA-binding transcriptional MerR regulator